MDGEGGLLSSSGGDAAADKGCSFSGERDAVRLSSLTPLQHTAAELAAPVLFTLCLGSINSVGHMRMQALPVCVVPPSKTCNRLRIVRGQEDVPS